MICLSFSLSLYALRCGCCVFDTGFVCVRLSVCGVACSRERGNVTQGAQPETEGMSGGGSSLVRPQTTKYVIHGEREGEKQRRKAEVEKKKKKKNEGR